jgi:hypothetical protein
MLWKAAPRLMQALLGSLMLMSIASCRSGTATGNDCAGWEPIYPSRDDRLTAETARAILEHDRHGEERCGWRK